MALENLGPYRLLKRIAKGGMADVFLAEKEQSHGLTQRLVVKCIRSDLREDPEFKRLFLREAATGLKLNHPNLVQIFGFESFAGQDILTMEYVDGPALSAFSNQIIPDPIVALIAKQILEGLAYLHDRQSPILHRDISPRNILLRKDGFVKLADFGIAKSNSPAPSPNETQALGSLRYASPERLSGQVFGPSSDIYSLCLVLMECATGFLSPASGDEKAREAWISECLESHPGKFTDTLAEFLLAEKDTRPAGESLVASIMESTAKNSASRQDIANWLVKTDSTGNQDKGKTRKLVTPTTRQTKGSIGGKMKKTAWIIAGLLFAIDILLFGALITDPQQSRFISPFPEKDHETSDRYFSESFLPIDSKTGCLIAVDGINEGKPPLILTLSPGRHRVERIDSKSLERIDGHIVFLAPGPNRELYLKH